MLPRWHIVLGAIFTFLLWLALPSTPIIFLVLVFLSSVLIDFDHYAAAVHKTKKLSLQKALIYHEEEEIKARKEIEKGIRKKSDFHLFHTIEFHFLIGILSLLWIGFFYIFLGMVFHSLVDLIDLISKKVIHRREFFLFNWVRKNL